MSCTSRREIASRSVARMRWASLSWAVARWLLPTNSRHELARPGRNRSTIIGDRTALRETQTIPRPLARTFPDGCGCAASSSARCDADGDAHVRHLFMDGDMVGL